LQILIQTVVQNISKIQKTMKIFSSVFLNLLLAFSMFDSGASLSTKAPLAAPMVPPPIAASASKSKNDSKTLVHEIF
jgi:hypothetical protein